MGNPPSGLRPPKHPTRGADPGRPLALVGETQAPAGAPAHVTPVRFLLDPLLRAGDRDAEAGPPEHAHRDERALRLCRGGHAQGRAALVEVVAIEARCKG